MALTIADFRLFYPEFADLVLWPDILVDNRLLQALRRVQECYFGARLDDAQGLLAAHLLKLMGNAAGGGGIGSIVEVQDGSTRIRFPEGTGSFQSSLGRTGYGQEFLFLVRLSGGMRLVRTGGCGC